MKRACRIGVLVFIGCVWLAAFLLQEAQIQAASMPFPEEITGSPLHRNECVTTVDDESNDPFTAHIQEFMLTDTRAGVSLYSCINWREGFLKSEGIGKAGSRRAAELVARSNAIKTLLVVNLHSRYTLQDYFSRQTQVQISIQNVLIKNARIEDLPPDPQSLTDARVMATIPFYGVSGLTSFLIDDQELYLQSPAAMPPSSEEIPLEFEDYTGILVDARGISDIRPALLPKIITPDGSIVYEAAQVEKSVLEEQGMIAYVHELTEQTAWRRGANPLVIKPLLLVSTTLTPGMLPAHQQEQEMGRYPLLAQETSPKRRRRRGNNLVVQADDSSGEIPVNVVVSVEDAKKIAKLNQEKELDKQGKYTILIGGEIGGVEGHILERMLARQHAE
ncbi:hypothetical protein GF339_13385 [candidate division KSB3 bacterium]|uniref:Uncharacterized protein n=1 Tax=candidate division KSB3 bacterium TaxID=2044937 RepID=A0A9D5JXL8_9BACT|nr:hypothetical protein [candidate division KSB3 bacterium]MBD3325571.1 hypothetical protein [candidate division KSB3 bacterium]